MSRRHQSSARSLTRVAAGAGIFALLGVMTSALAGCPIYGSDSCSSDPNCQPTYYPTTDGGGSDSPVTDAGVCPATPCHDGYVCDTTSLSVPTCVALDCRAPEKPCPSGKTCNDVGGGVFACTTATPIDCATTGCIAGYKCADGTPGTRICVSTDPNACVADADCVGKAGFGAGSLCLGGVCKAPKDLCSDQNQCNAGSSCVDGRCVPTCGTGSPACIDGYVCDAKTNACTGGAGTCSATSPCGSGLNCVAGRCVDKAQTNGTCPTSEVSVAGGCVIDDRANFFCDKSGTADGTRDICAASSLCLHHNCYVSCTGAGDTTSCAAVKGYPLCKAVTSSSGTALNVCGSSTSLGAECDPTSTPPKSCATGKVCIDGYCK